MTAIGKNHRIIVFGAGAVGGVMGAHLARSGAEVVLIGRSAQVDAVRQNGLRLITPVATYTVRMNAVTSPDQITFGLDDVVMLTVKSQSTEEALESLKSVVNDIPIFCCQNGVRNEETAGKIFPRVYCVSMRVGSVYVKTGEIKARNDPPGWLVMGRYPEGTDALVEEVASILRAASYYVYVTPEAMAYKWGGFIQDLGHAIGAITNSRPGSSVEYDRIAKALTDESREIVALAGIKIKSREELAQEWPEASAKPRGTMQTEELNSSWQSLTRKQGTVESEFLNGEIVRLAKRLGRRAPVNEGLISIANEMAAKRELPGKYTPAELAKLLGLV